MRASLREGLILEIRRAEAESRQAYYDFSGQKS